MTIVRPRSSRTDQSRKRRAQSARRRYESATRTTGRSLPGPLVSRPRRPGGLPPSRGGKLGFGSARRALGLPTRLQFALPTLPVGWRMLSLSLVIVAAAALAWTLTYPALFVDGINLGGSALVPGEEIYERSGTAGQHIFWVDPEDVQRRVAAIPGIASAAVTVEWPNLVTIVVTERIPVLTWIEGERSYWVDADGQKFKSRGELPGLLPLIVDGIEGKGGDTSDTPVPVAAIQGALQLRELRPNIELLHFDPLHGLSYQDGRGWRGYFGTGTDMAQKLAVYERLTADLGARGIYPRLISVENLQAPYYQK